MPEWSATSADPDAALIEVAGLEKRFATRVAVGGIDLSLRRGELHGLIGANGGGKTTTLRLLAGLLKPDAGSGRVLGLLLGRDATQIRSRIGYLPQRLSLYSELSLRENLRFRASVYGLPRPAAAADLALEDFGLSDRARLPAGALSGGLARRLQFAAALIHRPPLLLLDEPTAGLDAESRQDVWRRIAALATQGAGILLCTHDLAEAERCASLSFLVAGRCAASGTASDLVRRAAVQAYRIEGPAALDWIPALEAISGVIAVHPQGAGLRIVARPQAGAGLETRARSLRAELLPVRAQLEDAALAFVAAGN